MTHSQKPIVIIAFSGGLDTSFCVPYLREKGFDVITMFGNSGGLSDAENKKIESRSKELGALEHHTVDIGSALFDEYIVPIIKAGHWYQQRYPLLCSDRYLIAQSLCELAKQYQTQHVAHGCTGMGNDQLRLDLSIKAIGNFTIHAPIREIQAQHEQVRDYEIDYLQQRGFNVGQRESHYTANENLLGITLSGAEIDDWQTPGPESYIWTPAPGMPTPAPTELNIRFDAGRPTHLNEEPIDGVSLMQHLNHLAGSYGVGRGSYTGDTSIGLKGRIVFESPAIHSLAIAHKALEETVLSQAQNDFKPAIAKRWSELVYHGAWYEPLRLDLQNFIDSTQQHVTGSVSVTLSSGQVLPAKIDSPNKLENSNARYAQKAAWGQAEAEGFIQLHGQSMMTYANIHRPAQ